MRKRKEIMNKLRVNILEDKKNGLTYEEIRKKRGASPSTISKLTKGKDLSRFCQNCGETDPQKLEEHHPSKEHQPHYTMTLCANCHSLETRKQLKERRKTQEKVIVPQEVEVLPPRRNQILSPVPVAVPDSRTVVSTNTRPFTPQEKRRLARWGLFGAGGVAAGEAVFDKRLPWWARLGLLAGTGIALWIGGKIKPQPE